MRVRSLTAGKSVHFIVAALAISLGVFEPVAHAKDVPSTTTGYDLQLFHPAIDSKGYLTLNASQVLGLWDLSFGLVGTLAGQPLKLTGNDMVHAGTTFQTNFLLTPILQAALGFKYAELAVTLPVQILSAGWSPGFVSRNGPNNNDDLTLAEQGIGDLGLHVKARILNTSRSPVGLAVLASVYLPTAGGAFIGDGGIGIVPTIILDKDFGRARRFRMALNLGAHIRLAGDRTFVDNGQVVSDTGFNPKKTFCAPTTDTMGIMANPDGTCIGTTAGTGVSRGVGQQITYGIGASWAAIKERLDLVAELYGAVGFLGNDKPLEALIGAKVYLARNSFFSFGGGASLIPDQTQGALWRVFVGFVFEPTIGDRDGDGLKDDVDKCPDDPEDFDDFEDQDGCPDPDNDRDGILDEKDKCPNEPETKNGFQDEDGCPDSIELDRDGDGIPDSKDVCPDDPEDKDGFKDEDGCPDPDNDEDGILDVDDLCPNDPEDKDGFEDQDGCPDPDNDKDKILDVNDKCPNEPETYNGFQDEDGCPDKGKVIIREGMLEILDKIFFETDKAIIKPISFPLLDAVRDTLQGNLQIGLIEIQGHADERGDDDHNMKLTEDRAQSVRQYLVDHGVAPERLQAHGYGETKPLCKQKTEECWSRNRRVEFVIMKRAKDAP